MSVIEGEKATGSVVSLFVLKHTPPVYLWSRHHPGTDITPAASLDLEIKGLGKG